MTKHAASPPLPPCAWIFPTSCSPGWGELSFVKQTGGGSDGGGEVRLNARPHIGGGGGPEHIAETGEITLRVEEGDAESCILKPTGQGYHARIRVKYVFV